MKSKKIYTKLAYYVSFSIKTVKQEGLISFIKRCHQKFRKENIKKSSMYKEMLLSDKLIHKQLHTNFRTQPLISILVPLYNTPIKFFNDMISSVLGQTYINWQLILTDASDHNDLEKIVSDIDDKRIVYTILTTNLGIVENTNNAFMKANGDYIGLLDHDDILAQDCLYEIVKEINKKNADIIYTDEVTFKKNPFRDCYQPNLKPDYSPDTLRSYNYICHFMCFRKDLIRRDETFLNKEMEGSQDYDLILRLTERTKKISHISKVLYFWRAHNNSVAQDAKAKPYAVVAAKKALTNHLKRVNLHGTVIDNVIPTTYRIKYGLRYDTTISIIIPTKDHIDDLKRCIESIYSKTTYKKFEIILIENNSDCNETFEFYKKLENDYNSLKIVYYNGSFNFSKIVNFGKNFAIGEFLVLLNNDTEIITGDWLDEMLMFAQREDVGCVGSKLLYSDNTIQHAGIILGLGGVAGHSHKYFKRNDYGFMSRIQISQNLSAVTAACLMIRKKYYEEVNGFDENLAVAFNDVDFCLKVLRKGYLNIYTPYAELYHYESKSRGKENSEDKIKRFKSEIDYFSDKWGLWKMDKYYNKNLTLLSENFWLRRNKSIH